MWVRKTAQRRSRRLLFFEPRRRRLSPPKQLSFVRRSCQSCLLFCFFIKIFITVLHFCILCSSFLFLGFLNFKPFFVSFYYNVEKSFSVIFFNKDLPFHFYRKKPQSLFSISTEIILFKHKHSIQEFLILKSNFIIYSFLQEWFF
jgi:hypothetical protein